jgi:hypothetical protein
MPHSGPRGSPDTDTRAVWVACKTAAATVVPGATRMIVPFTVTAMERAASDMRFLGVDLPAACARGEFCVARAMEIAGRQIRLRRNLRFFREHCGRQ